MVLQEKIDLATQKKKLRKIMIIMVIELNREVEKKNRS